MNHSKFRKAYFEQYATEDDVYDKQWFPRFFEGSIDWMEEIHSFPDDGIIVYSDPESDIGGFWATTDDDSIEGPFATLEELAVALDYPPDDFCSEIVIENDEITFDDDDEGAGDEDFDDPDFDDEEEEGFDEEGFDDDEEEDDEEEDVDDDFDGEDFSEDDFDEDED